MSVIWLLVLVGICALAQAVFFRRRALRHVHYQRRFGRERVFTGETVELIEVLANEKLLPVPWVRVESRIDANLRFKRQDNLEIADGLFHKSLFYLGSYRRVTRTHQIQCLHRGYYDCSNVSIAGGDLLGLAVAHHEQTTDAKLLVYPRLLKPDELPENALKWQGDITVRRWIMPDPILVTGIRDYRYGDSRRDVHWGATARTGQLQVKMRDYTVSPRVLLALNCQSREDLWAGMAPEEKDFIENGVDLCASLAAWCLDNSIDFAFSTNGEIRTSPGEDVYLPPRCTRRQLTSVLELLALLDIRMRIAMQTQLDRHIAAGMTDMDIVVISAYWSDELEKRARRLRRMGNSVTFLPIRPR